MKKQSDNKVLVKFVCSVPFLASSTNGTLQNQSYVTLLEEREPSYWFVKSIKFNPFPPNFPLWYSEIIRKPLVLWRFQGYQKRILGRKGLKLNKKSLDYCGPLICDQETLCKQTSLCHCICPYLEYVSSDILETLDRK